MKTADATLADIREGRVYQFTRKISSDDVARYAELTGDVNPLHVDKEFGASSQFGRNVVHGMFAAGLFSTLIGMHCVGSKVLYLSQTLHFRGPIFHDDTVTVKGVVVSKNVAIRLVTLNTEILKDGKVCINGEAKIKVLDG